MTMKIQGDPRGAPLTDERIRLLDEIGFEWCLKPLVLDDDDATTAFASVHE